MMKMTMIVTMLLTVVSVARADEVARKNGLYWNVPEIVIGGEVGLEYERVYGGHFALGVGVAYYDSRAQLVLAPEYPTVGASFTFQPRLFFTGHAPSGFYVAGLGRLLYVSAQTGDGDDVDVALGDASTVTGTGYAIGATVGYAWVMRGFAIRAGIGALYQVLSITDEYGDEYGVTGVRPVLDLSLGWVF